MVAFQPISLLVCVCLLASVSGEVPGDGDHGDGELGHGQKSCVCTRNEYFIHTSFNRTCKQDLLLEVRDAVRYLYKDVKHLANTSYWIHQGVYDLKTARERSTSELKYEIQHGFEEVNKKIDETQHLIRSESEKVITAQQTAVYKLAQVGPVCHLLLCAFWSNSAAVEKAYRQYLLVDSRNLVFYVPNTVVDADTVKVV